MCHMAARSQSNGLPQRYVRLRGMEIIGSTHNIFCRLTALNVSSFFACLFSRLCTIRSTPQPVMCGVLGVSCMRYGVSDTNHLKDTQILM